MSAWNPDKVPRPGNGYRFLDEDEVVAGVKYPETDFWDRYKRAWLDNYGKPCWAKSSNGGTDFTLRTKLTKDEFKRALASR